MLNLLSEITETDILIMATSAVLMLAAGPLVRWLNNSRINDDSITLKIRLMRTLNGLIILAIIVKTVLISQLQHTWLSIIVQVLITVYFAVLITQIIRFLILRRFGKQRYMQDILLIADTYSSRGLSLLTGTFISIIALIIILKIIGLNSWLEASGVLGIIGLFLAMTQATWAPDILSGLIILNSRLCEEGDVVQLHKDNRDIIVSVFKTKLCHTEFLELANNHRLMIRNAKLRDCTLHNLSRFASARGARECLTFNIGYEHNQESVTAMFKRAFTLLDTIEDAREEQFDPEVRVLDTGDYAVTWGVYYYIKDVKSLLASRQIIRSYILQESIVSKIDLSTPLLHQNTHGTGE